MRFLKCIDYIWYVGEKIIALTDELRKQWQKQKAKEAFLRRIERQWQIMPPQYWQSSM